MSTQMEISKLMHHITHRWHRLVWAEQMKTGIDQNTICNGRILDYVERNEGKDIFQKDVERDTGLTKSAISNILSDMERRGYVKRLSVDGDARLKKIVITDRGREVNRTVKKSFDNVDARSLEGLEEKEQDELIRLLSKIDLNMKKMEEKMKHD